MAVQQSFFSSLNSAEVANLRERAETQYFCKNELVFSQGDSGDSFYIIDNGSVSVFYEDKGKRKHLRELGVGEYFGEMGIFNNDRRSASVITLEDTTLICLDKQSLLDLIEANHGLGEKIQNILAQRNEELILRESLCDAMGIRGDNLYVSIKGDPSLRETALFRERYQSPLDKILRELQPNLIDLVLNRCVFHLVVHFNSGEITVRTVFDPFREKVHTADKLVDKAYIDRHFIQTSYEEKLDFIKSIYQFVSESDLFARFPEQWKNIFAMSREHWQPLAKNEVENVMSHLVELRNVPEFYLRNVGVNLTQDAIRLQFNCDGTHIVSAEDYQDFIKKNFTFV